MRPQAILVAVLSMLPACRHGGTDASGAKDISLGLAGGFPSADICGPGETAQPFGLIATPDIADVERNLVPLKGEITLKPNSEAPLSGIRLDVCIDAADHATLRRIIERAPSAGFAFSFQYNEYTPDHIAADPGLTKALFDGGYDDFHVEFRSKDLKVGKLLQGAKTAAGLPYATWSNFDPASGAVTTPSTPYVRYGTLVVGDPFIPKIKENNRLITGPHLSLELDYGYFGGPGIYASYRFQGIVLKDSNPKLPQPLVFKVSGPDVDKYLKTVSSHHSLSDEFIITLPEATYHLGGAASGVRITYADASIPVEVVPMDCNYLVECGKLLSGPSTGQ